MCPRPGPARLGRLLGGLMVAGHQHGWLVDATQDVDAHRDMTTNIADIAGADKHIGRTGTLQQAPGGCGRAIDPFCRSSPATPVKGS